MEAWHDFWVAQIGASAALAGLLFVSVSINLTKILATPGLPDRAAVPFVLLLGILLTCSLLLVPDRPGSITPIEILICGLVIWGVVSYFDLKRLRQLDRQYWRFEPGRVLLTQLASLPYVIAGIVLVSGDLNGLYWVVPAVVASYIKSFTDAWVLLIEINR
jgi:hypothetical protein